MVYILFWRLVYEVFYNLVYIDCFVYHFDMTPGKSVSRVPSRVVISTTWLSLLAMRTSWFVAAAMLVEV